MKEDTDAKCFTKIYLFVSNMHENVTKGKLRLEMGFSISKWEKNLCKEVC